MQIEVGAVSAAGQTARHELRLNTVDVFPLVTAVEWLATVEISDADGHTLPIQLLFSRHDYEAGATAPLQLAQPQYDQLQLNIDWQSEMYAFQGVYADWINDHSALWNRVMIAIAGREPLLWSEMRADQGLLHRELAAAAYEDQIDLIYLGVDGQQERFGVDRVPYYTKFELVHSPHDEQLFYTIRAGRDPRVSEEMLEAMGGLVRHMFTERPDYLHELAANAAVHSVAPGQDMSVLPEIGILSDEILDVIVEGDEYGIATGIALLNRHPEISASAGYFFENETPALGYTLMHEVVHQLQVMVYDPDWNNAVIHSFETYMRLPDQQRIPNVDYNETSPWEWDALLTPAWLAQGSLLADHVGPYLDLEVGPMGSTIREHLQLRWGDSLPDYAELE
jgi:hypothetical protein